MNHYDWLDKYFPKFLNVLNVDFEKRCPGIISAHGDKCSGYRSIWEKYGISFHHGVAVYLLTYLRPWGDEARDDKESWVDPGNWVILNYHERFKSILEDLEKYWVGYYHARSKEIEEAVGYSHGTLTTESMQDIVKKIWKAGYNVMVLHNGNYAGVIWIDYGRFTQR